MTKHQHIADALAEAIHSGKFEPQCPIPSERALMARFKASRGTVREALDTLERGGLIVRKHGRPTMVADGVVPKATKIGVMISGCTQTEIYSAISSEVVRLAGADKIEVSLGELVRGGLDSNGAMAYRVAREMVASGVRGVILLPLQYSRRADEINQELVNIFRRGGVEVVLADGDVVRKPDRSALDVIGIDNFTAGRMAAEHAISRGAKKILFIARRGCADTVHDRWAGVKSCSDRAKVEGLYLNSFSDHSHIREELSKIKKLDTVICQNDVAALNVMRALAEVGIHVPSDVMLIGFDDVQLASQSHPGLTSIHQPCADIAAHAYRRLLERFANPQLAPVHVTCRETLTARGSTDRNWA